jgi:hypothetical protein
MPRRRLLYPILVLLLGALLLWLDRRTPTRAPVATPTTIPYRGTLEMRPGTPAPDPASLPPPGRGEGG